ncbi:hypothetical protein WG922_02275 [Ramlibacter sp. AN1015]|uniref:hypothetical protein n=1 Tax=Ramlibacter sp. AN1015 TaxID=3133428 RepID=UPI0030BFFDF9
MTLLDRAPGRREPDTSPDGSGLSTVLAALCEQLGALPRDTDGIVRDGFLRLDAIDVGFELDASAARLHILADCGRPAPRDEAVLYRTLLERALAPGRLPVVFGLHPGSGTVVACASLELCQDELPSRAAAAVRHLATQAGTLRARFALRPLTQGYS